MNPEERPLDAASIPSEDRALIAVVAGVSFIMVGICAVAAGMLFDPLMREFGWKNAAVSGLATVYSLASLLSGPVIGVMIDRWGSRRVMALGVVVTALGFLGLARCQTLNQIYIAFVVIGVGYGGAFFLSSTTMIARRLGPHKNVGMGAIMGAGSTGAALFSVLIGRAIVAYGWRDASIIGAAVMAAALLPLLLFIPARAHTAAGRTTADDGDPSGESLPPIRVFLAPSFLTIAAASALASFGMSAVYFHAVPIFVQAGFSSGSAGAVLGASWLLSALGSVVSGIVANRLGAQNVLAASLLLGAVGTIFLATLSGGLLGIVSVAIFITLWGATANAINQFLPILLADRFGSIHLGALNGVQSAVMGLVGSFAPLATGALFDLYASYRVSIFVSTLATLAALGLVYVFKRQATEHQFIEQPNA